MKHAITTLWEIGPDGKERISVLRIPAEQEYTPTEARELAAKLLDWADRKEAK